MTEAQAHEFLSKCERYLLWRKVGNELEVIEKINRYFRPAIIGWLVPLAVVTRDFVQFKAKPPLDVDGYYFSVIMLSLLFIIAMGMFVFSIWISIRMRQVSRAIQ